MFMTDLTWALISPRHTVYGWPQSFGHCLWMTSPGHTIYGCPRQGTLWLWLITLGHSVFTITRLHEYLLASDIRMFTGLCLGEWSNLDTLCLQLTSLGHIVYDWPHLGTLFLMTDHTWAHCVYDWPHLDTLSSWRFASFSKAQKAKGESSVLSQLAGVSTMLQAIIMTSITQDGEGNSNDKKKHNRRQTDYL